MILVAPWRSLSLGRKEGAPAPAEEKLSARLLLTSGFVAALSSVS